jgi:toxin ParE1/3/4
MQLLITPLAAFDLEEIGDYIAHDNPIRARTFVAELRAHCEKICLNSAGYRLRPEVSDDLRSCAHGNYVIFLSPLQSRSQSFA